jgi:hypothetical protein
MPNSKHIPIDKGDGHIPSPHDNEGVSKRNDQVVWDDAKNSGPFSVEFDPNHHPFSQWKFDVPKGGSSPPSDLVVTGNVGESFKYSVKGPNGTNDPRVIINN